MSVIFPYKAFSEVNDFYESIQGIHDSPRNNDNFGKPVSTPIQYANFKNPSFLKEMNALLTNEGGVKKCFSNNSFHENEFNLQMYSRKMSIGCYPENQSSMTSSSSLTSFNSYSSTSLTNPGNNASNSTANTGTANSKSKTKAKKSAKKKKPGEIDYRKKYKTELCKYWAEKGFCEFGDSCAFAHSTTEIRQKIHISSNYKTKQCTSFHELGYCPYGVRCQFIHTLRKEGNVIADFDSMSYAELMENPELWVTHEADCVCLQRQHRPRFPSFVKALSLDSVEENDDANKENNKENCENCHEIIF